MGRTLVSETSWFDSLAEPECRYPVIVTVEHTHVLWVEAEDQEHALRRAQGDGALYERLDDQETHVSYGISVRKPGEGGGDWSLRMDWELIYEGDYYSAYQGLSCNAHVESHNFAAEMAKRAEQRRLCKEAGHPDLEVREHTKDRAFCRHCGWLDLAQIVADLRAVAEEGREGDTP